MDLTPELAVELQEHRAEPVGEDCWIGGDGWHFVNQVNESARPAASLSLTPRLRGRAAAVRDADWGRGSGGTGRFPRLSAPSGRAQSRRAQSTRRHGPRAPDSRRAALSDHWGPGPDRLDLGPVQAARAGPDDAGTPGRARRADRTRHRQGAGPRPRGVPANPGRTATALAPRRRHPPAPRPTRAPPY